MQAPPPPSSSDDTPTAFSLLAHGVQRQLYRIGWRELRPIQSRAIRAFHQSDCDLLITAETAGGKTEAAFLPVLSAISELPKGSVRALYVGPLKALINDQFARLEELCTYLEVAVHRWHGDVSVSRKAALVSSPGGVLLITPESLESLLVNRTTSLPRLFGGLRAIVVDEVHAFLEGERGLHLASLLARLRACVHPRESRCRTIGLSATVGDVSVARAYLSPDEHERVEVIDDAGGDRELQLRVHGYTLPEKAKGAADDQAREESPILRAMAQIAEDLVEHCRTHSNLVFVNSRGSIEQYADLANERCRIDGLPEQFLVHHGSLAKDVREDTEFVMKSGRPMTTICSSTLEMGIDIGSVRMVGQIGAPWSVASLKQRVGRSGRRDGEPRRFRAYVICRGTSGQDTLAELPTELLQTVAVCELMLSKWIEPPQPTRLDLSTLTQQVISMIAQHGAAKASSLFEGLCRRGPFRSFTPALFTNLLEDLCVADVIEQGPDGKLILGLTGERIRASRDFYSAFSTPAEYAVVAPDRVIGSIPVDTVPKPGAHILFAARRWLVTEVDDVKFKLYVAPAGRGAAPTFLGGGGDVHPRVREEMRSLLLRSDVPVYLDRCAAQALQEARIVAREAGLAERRITPSGQSRCLWTTWRGTREQRTLCALLTLLGIAHDDRNVAIECRVPASELESKLASVLPDPPSVQTLSAHVSPLRTRKYDHLVSDATLRHGVAADRLAPLSPALLTPRPASVPAF